jgi:spermidine synthase
VARKRELIDKTRLPGGKELTLTTEEGYFVLTLGGVPLMSSAAHHSEERLAEIGCEGIKTVPNTRVLIGGLGMGYTLRAALDQTSATSTVVVVELVPAVVRWNEGPLADLANRPLEDPRAELVVGDIVAYVRSRPEPFDAILLDTDNGPDDFTSKGNARLYDTVGLATLRGILKPGGRLVVWSAYQCPAFVKDLQRADYEASVVKAKSRGDKGGRHTLYVGTRVEPEVRFVPRQPKGQKPKGRGKQKRPKPGKPRRR